MPRLNDLKLALGSAACGLALWGLTLGLDACSTSSQQQVQVTMAAAQPIIEIWCQTVPAQDAIFQVVAKARSAPQAILDAEAKAFRGTQAFCTDVPTMTDPTAMLKAGVDVVQAVNPNLIAVGLAPIVIPSTARVAATSPAATAGQ